MLCISLLLSVGLLLTTGELLMELGFLSPTTIKKMMQRAIRPRSMMNDGDDQWMDKANARPRGGTGDGRGSSKKKGGSGDINGLTGAMDRLGLRDKKQEEADSRRRLATQCQWIGWQAADAWDPPELVTSRNRAFRQCRSTMTCGFEPRCKPHFGEPMGDPNDPDEIDPPEGRKKSGKKKLTPSSCAGGNGPNGGGGPSGTKA